jgi:hypothetical protein
MVNGFFREISEEEIMSVNGGYSDAQTLKQRLHALKHQAYLESGQLYLVRNKVNAPIPQPTVSSLREIITFEVKSAKSSGGVRG